MKKQDTTAKSGTYARICSVTGEGMNDGWVVESELRYFKYEADALAYALSLGYSNLEDAWDHDAIYYTDWELANEMYHYIIDESGNVTEVNYYDEEE